MYTIKTLNNIAPAGLAKLGPAQFKVDNEADTPQGILVRSAKMHEMELPESLLAIGRAGAGVNNIPVEKCSEAGVVVFNTPGANAGGVAELTIGGLVLASRNLLPAMEWAQGLAGEGDAVPALVEKGKSQFVGPELAGKKLGVVGLGAIGVKVANAAVHLGMEVFGYDPYISVQAAWNLSRGVRHSVSLTELVAQCDYITLHLPANAQTKGFMNAGVFRACKPGLRLLNFARGELVNNADLLAALAEGQLAAYVTDFPAAELLGVPGVTCIPHLGASTPESEENCAVMAASQLADYLLNGNIVNSVNMPEVVQARAAGKRVCVIHKNEPGLISAITAVITQSKLNIENMVNKSKKEMAYTMLDATGGMDAALAEGQLAAYVTDFPAAELLGVPGVTCIPHLGASTPESEENCAVMAASQLADYLLNGNIVNSVNMPEVVQARAAGKRVCVIHKNEPGLISAITAVITQSKLNIENMVNKSKKEMAYTMLDVTGGMDAALADQLAAIPSVIRVRVL